MSQDHDGKTKIEPSETDQTPGGLLQEKFEDRPNISVVKPEKYPDEQCEP